MILQEGDSIPAGYYIPRESTVKIFQSEFVAGIGKRARVGYFGGYLSGS